MSRTLENAIVRLLKERPFYGHLLAGVHKATGESSYPLGITLKEGVPELSINCSLFAEFSPLAQEALLEHCIKHLLHLHPSRRKDRNRHDWDLACDLAINQTITAMPPDAPMPEYLHLPDGLAAEEYYHRLVDPFDCGNLNGSGTGRAGPEDSGKADKGTSESTRTESAAASPLDDHQSWDEADSTPLRLAEEMVRSMVGDAVRRCDGRVPGDIRPLVESMLSARAIPWRMVLRQFVATAGRIGKKATWQRENRRFAHATPGARKKHRLHLLIGVDVSDSTDAPRFREAFARELLRIARGRDTLLTVIYANSSIQRIDSFQGHAVVAESYHGGGFTDLRPVFDHARTMHPRPAAVIYLTDGVGPAPDRMEFPTLWVLTREGEKPSPWGIELRLDQ